MLLRCIHGCGEGLALRSVACWTPARRWVVRLRLSMGCCRLGCHKDRNITLLQALWGARIRHAVALLRRALPRADIVLLGVLPRGGWTLGADVYQWPNRLTAPIAAVNNGTQVRCVPCSIQIISENCQRNPLRLYICEK